MELWEEAAKVLKKIPKDYYMPIGFGCIGLILFGYGFYVLVYQPQLRENSASSNFSQSSASANSPQASKQTVSTIKVDVEGAVANPGVYSLATDARVQDGMVAAGGLSENADRTWVDQHVNLALKLTDGTKIYIPHVGEVTQASTVATADQSISVGDVLGASTSQQIDINSANATDLDSLPGVGPATANKIIAGRPYASIQDLVTKKIVGPKEFEKIKDVIVTQ